MSRIYQVHIADGFVDDCEELFLRCLKYETLTFENFTEAWMEVNMGGIYHERTVGAEVAELSEEVIHIAKRYMVADTGNFEESVAGLFLVYCLLNLQPFKGFAPLRLIPDDVPAIRRIELVARRERRLDVLYILGEVLIRGPVQYHAEPREYGFEQSLRKYHEGCTSIDKYGIRPKGVFYRQNEELDWIKDLQNITTRYEEAKASVSKLYPNIQLSYSEKQLPAELDASLKRIINGLPADADHNVDCANSEERSDRVREIKARAMSRTIDPMRHLTSTSTSAHNNNNNTHAAHKTRTPNKEKQARGAKLPRPEDQHIKPDIRSKAGKVKTGSPQKPPATGSRKRKLANKKRKAKKSKNVVSSSESSEEDISIKSSDEESVENNEESADLNFEEFHKTTEEDKNTGVDIDELVEKEFDIHIDSVPIVIKGNPESNFEIEIIDQYKPFEDKVESERLKQAKNKVKVLKDVSLVKVPNRYATEDNIGEQSTSDLASISKIDDPNKNYTLRKPEKRELKKPILKSKFKKLGLEPLANFEDSKKPNEP